MVLTLHLCKSEHLFICRKEGCDLDFKKIPVRAKSVKRSSQPIIAQDERPAAGLNIALRNGNVLSPHRPTILHIN